MHIPATILYLAILYVVFQSVLMVMSIAAGTVIILYGVCVLITGDSTKSKGLMLNTMTLLSLLAVVLAALWNFYMH